MPEQNRRKRVLSPQELGCEYLELLKEGAELPITVSGSSMSPFLVGGRDSVRLRAIDRALRRGDIVLYRRAEGRYVLHRLYRIEQGKMWFVGDAQDQIEGPLEESCALAYVTEAVRKGRTVKPGSPCWNFFSRLWLGTVGARREILATYSNVRPTRTDKKS